MALKRESNYSNAICVPKLVENEVLRQILGPLFKNVENPRWLPAAILDLPIQKYVHFPRVTSSFF